VQLKHANARVGELLHDGVTALYHLLKVSNMSLRIASAFVALLAITCIDRPVEAAGSLQGTWEFSVPYKIGAAEPFTAPANVFTFTQATTGGVFQAQNAPANGSGQPLCAMNAEFSEGIFIGRETCGLPRSSSGTVIGYVNPFARTIHMVWIDSKGIYGIRGFKRN
jgi:hypothetical protein